MKIIGKQTEISFIVLASGDELAQIAGFSYVSLMKDLMRPQVGREINVSELYRALNASRERKAEIAELANKLRVVAGRVDSINQALASPIIEVEIKT